MSEKTKIFRIPEHISIKIAAGEVIETPSSVVKELIENSIDAGAKRIEVEIAGGGKKLIKIKDDGIGMSNEDAKLSLERFTTSKLKLSSTLLEDIETLGFRGEALASIASVSQLFITTRTKNDETATYIYSEGGKIKEESKKAHPIGTTIEVKNLFYNFPARRKFLKKESTEQGRIETLVAKLMLPHNRVSFSLSNETKRLFGFEKGEPLDQRIKKIFPKSSVPSLEFDNSAGGYGVSGIITPQGIDFPTSANIHLYVNGRMVKDRVINHAVCEALRTHISGGRYPGGIVFLQLPLEAVDVNVHPTKAEVKFLDSNFAHNFVLKSIQASLSKSLAPLNRPTLLETHEETFIPFANMSRTYKNIKSYPYNETKNQQKVKSVQSGYFANLEILGQLKNSYIICGDSKGVIIIDQHAAHERVTFENLKINRIKNGITSQNLLFPTEFELKPARANLLRKRIREFKSFGFIIEEFGENSFIIRSVPELLTDTDHVKTVEDVLEMMAELKSSSETEKITDEILETMACHSSVRFSKALSHEEIHALLAELDELKNAKTCPHGRPFMVSLDETSLRKMFKRT